MAFVASFKNPLEVECVLPPVFDGTGGWCFCTDGRWTFAGTVIEWPRQRLAQLIPDRILLGQSHPRVRQMGYKAVRTERWKYIHYYELDGMDELYDLTADPYEMKNIINQPEAAAHSRR